MADEQATYTQMLQWSAGAAPSDRVLVCAKNFTDTSGIEWVFDHQRSPTFLLNDAIGGIDFVLRRKGSPALSH